MIVVIIVVGVIDVCIAVGVMDVIDVIFRDRRLKQSSQPRAVGISIRQCAVVNFTAVVVVVSCRTVVVVDEVI